MRGLPLIVLLTAAAAPLPVWGQARLSPSDEAAAFRAAGFKRIAGKWQACGDPGTASYEPGRVDTVRDLNGDGLPEVVIIEGSSSCFGMTGQGYVLVSKQAGGAWRLITGGAGIATFLPRRAATGWPDIEIGGPGFCFPVQRWSGKHYVTYRFQYEGRPCRPPRP